MKKSVYLLVITITLLITGVSAVDDTNDNVIEIQASHGFMLEGFTWKSFEMDCLEGDTLTGSFKVECDGSLYIGDEQRYDDWSLEGIDFYILDEGNFSLFIQRDPFETAFARNDVQSLSWTFEIPSDGVWYIIYENRSIYLMNIEGSMGRIDDSNNIIAMTLIVLAGAAAVGIILFVRRK